METELKNKTMEWRVHTPQLLKEIVDNNPTAFVLKAPIQIFGTLLYKVAQRCSKLNDPELNELMARLTLYEIADPYSENYDPQKTNELIYNKKS